VTLIVGTIAAVAVIGTWRQKNKSDNRSEWWRRTAWAFERTFSDSDPEAELGWKGLSSLTGFRVATRDDSDMIEVIAEEVALGATGEKLRRSLNVRRAAARAAVAASEKTGRPVAPTVAVIARD
jgi:hypothetical protein